MRRCTKATMRFWRGSAMSGVASRSWPRSTRSSSPTWTHATASSRSSKIWRLFLRRYADGIEASPARLQQVEERLALLDRLKRKYGPSLADVVARRDALRRELEELQQGDDTDRAARTGTCGGAGALPRLRPGTGESQAGVRWTVRLASSSGLLAELAMERTRFEVRFADADAPFPESCMDREGIDVAEFFVSPNPGEDLRPLARIVSGGELSRIMLAIKTLTFGARVGGRDGRVRRGVCHVRNGAPGLIFDESTPASADGWPTSSDGSCRRSARRFRCCASRTCRRSRRTPTRTSRSRSACGGTGPPSTSAGSRVKIASTSSRGCWAGKRLRRASSLGS